MEVNDNILSEFECPVCRDIMAAPIRICSEGHSYCNDCYEQVTSCPVCRSYQDGARNYLLEEFGREIVFNCSNYLDGCEFKGGIENVKEHVTFCKYTFTNCPLACVRYCKWIGPYEEVMEHCLKMHPNNTFKTNRQLLKCENFLDSDDKNVLQLKHYYILIEAYGELFKCTWDLNCSTGFMMWRVIYLGPNEKATKFTFKVEFASTSSISDIFLSVQAACQPMVLNQLPTSNMYASTNKRSLVKYCVGGDLYYTIAIHSSTNICNIKTKDDSKICIPEPCVCKLDR